MRRHFTDVIAFNETDQTITVEAGISGPALEEALNQAPERFGAARRYTCGHFPQSLEYSSVGGWVVTRGAGQNSTYYGNIKDIVMGQWYATPAGPITTYGLPAHAVGPDLDEIMMGSEGAFGVLTHVTLKVFRLTAKNRRKFSYIFPTWEAARNAAREMMQSEAGYPSVFRLSDPEETDVMLKLYSVEGTVLDTAMSLFGYKPMERCLLLGWTEGERGFSRNLRRVVGKTARRHGGLGLTGYPTSKWGARAIPRPVHARGVAGLRRGDRHHGVRRALGQHGGGPRRRAGVCQEPTADGVYDASLSRVPAGCQLIFHFHRAFCLQRGVPGVPVRHLRQHQEVRRVHEPPPRCGQDDLPVGSRIDRGKPACGLPRSETAFRSQERDEPRRNGGAGPQARRLPA